MSKKILICGDSFGTTDKKFPGLHFSEKIKEKVGDCEIINLSVAGHSNSLIELQVNQGLLTTPDYAIVLFTSPDRYEFDKKHSKYWPKHIHPIVNDKDKWADIKNCNMNYLTTAMAPGGGAEHESDDLVVATKLIYKLALYKDTKFEYLKQYFTMMSILRFLDNKNIPFCFNLGGLNFSPAPALPSLITMLDDILEKHFLTNELVNYESNKINTTLWTIEATTSQNWDFFPRFHQFHESIQSAFADECIAKLGLV